MNHLGPNQILNLKEEEEEGRRKNPGSGRTGVFFFLFSKPSLPLAPSCPSGSRPGCPWPQ